MVLIVGCQGTTYIFVGVGTFLLQLTHNARDGESSNGIGTLALIKDLIVGISILTSLKGATHHLHLHQ